MIVFLVQMFLFYFCYVISGESDVLNYLPTLKTQDEDEVLTDIPYYSMTHYSALFIEMNNQILLSALTMMIKYSFIKVCSKIFHGQLFFEAVHEQFFMNMNSFLKPGGLNKLIDNIRLSHLFVLQMKKIILDWLKLFRNMAICTIRGFL